MQNADHALHRVGVVIDGKFISFDHFAYLLQTYEGFQFSLRIADPYDEL